MPIFQPQQASCLTWNAWHLWCRINVCISKLLWLNYL